MSYVLSVLRDDPIGLWMLDTAELTSKDYSKYQTPGTGSAISTAFPLVSSAAAADIFNGAAITTLPSNAPVYRTNNENKPFTLEAWANVITLVGSTPSDQVIIGTPSNIDGLIINGTVVKFRLLFTNAPVAELTYDMVIPQKVHIVGTYQLDRIRLYINGENVGELELTDEQLADTFLSNNVNFTINENAGGQTMTVNAIAIYNSILYIDQIQRHYAAGINVPPSQTVISAYNGIKIDVDRNAADISLVRVWDTYEDFVTGYMTDSVIGPNLSTIQPDTDDDTGLTLAGTWTTSIPIEPPDQTTVFGAVADWVGDGMSVDLSLDGLSWVPAVSGIRTSLIAPGLDVTDKDLFIRVTFTAGVDVATTYLDTITVTIFRSGILSTPTLRSVLLNGNVTINYPIEPFYNRDNAGIFLSGGSITIGQDADTDIQPIYTVELWAKRYDGHDFNVTIDGVNFDDPTNGTQYKNGSHGSAMPGVGQWTLVHMVLNSPVTQNIVVTHPNMSISQIVLYDRQLSATDVTEIFNAYTNGNIQTIIDTGSLGVSLPNIDAYSHDWAIVGAM